MMSVQYGFVVLMSYTFVAECLIFNPASTTTNQPIPQYRFHYYVRDESTGDYKSQEEHRNGNSVSGSYMVAEPNGDLRVVKYVADVSNGFKADVNIQPGGSPMKNGEDFRTSGNANHFKNSRPINSSFEGNAKVPNVADYLKPKVAAPSLDNRKTSNVANYFKTTTSPSPDDYFSYDNHRTGISPPPRKPVRGYYPIVVRSLYSQQASSTVKAEASYETYPYYVTQNTTVTPKSIQVEINYKDESAPTTEPAVLKSTEFEKLESNDSTPAATENNLKRTSTNGIYQLSNMDIPSSIMQILNQHKTNPAEEPDSKTDIVNSETTTQTTSTTDVTTTTASSTLPKFNLPQRPMRLIGLSPIYMDNFQLQALTENSTLPQLYVESIPNIQYATPAPFFSGPLLGGPLPFKNLPRSVAEPTDLKQSLPISAPIVQPLSQQIDERPQALPLCNDCLLPPNYMPSYPLAKLPQVPNGNQKPCQSTGNAPYWPSPYKPGVAYILMPSQIIKSNL